MKSVNGLKKLLLTHKTMTDFKKALEGRAILFTQELADKVLTGEKTVTRRRVKEDIEFGGLRHCDYERGLDYRVKASINGPTLGVIQVKGISLEGSHNDIDEADATREGFPDRQAFLAYWDQLPPRPDLGVWRIEFELVEVLDD